MLHVWNLNGECIGTQAVHRGAVSCLSNIRTDLGFNYATQGSPLILSGGSDGLMRLWDLKRLKLLSEVNSGVVNKIIWAGQAAITGGANGCVRLWNYVLNPSDSNSAGGECGIRDWTSRDIGAHSQSCTELICNDNMIASGIKTGQIYVWARC